MFIGRNIFMQKIFSRHRISLTLFLPSTTTRMGNILLVFPTKEKKTEWKKSYYTAPVQLAIAI